MRTVGRGFTKKKQICTTLIKKHVDYTPVCIDTTSSTVATVLAPSIGVVLSEACEKAMRVAREQVAGIEANVAKCVEGCVGAGGGVGGVRVPP